MFDKDLTPFFKKINIKPKNTEIYERAFTHSSFNFDANTNHKDYEKLEFMGDSIIGFVVAELVYTLHNDLSQGDMTKVRSNLVQSRNLKILARRYDMDKYVLVGKSLVNQNYLEMPHLLEDIFEAVMGALYIDQGLKTTYGVIKSIFYESVLNFDFSTFNDYKSTLQEEFQSEKKTSVQYKVTKESGPAHDRMFEVEVSYNNLILGKGSGKTKKDAEQAAAKDALSKKA